VFTTQGLELDGYSPINLVRGDIVVTQPTREELVATVSQDLATSAAGSSVRSALRIIYLQYYMPHLPLVVLAAKMKFLFVLHPEWNKISTCCNTEEGTEKLPDRTAKGLAATR
jgi:hypothetical protein